MADETLVLTPPGVDRPEDPDRKPELHTADAVPQPLRAAAAIAWRFLVVAAAVVVVGYAASRLRLVLLPLAIALLLATLLVPPARWLERRGAPPGLAAFTVVLGWVALVSGVLTAVTPSFATQISDLNLSVSEGLRTVGQWLNNGPLNLSDREVDELVDRISAEIRENRSRLLSGALTGAVIVAEVVAGLLLTLVLLFFFVKDGTKLWDWCSCAFVEPRRTAVREIGDRSWIALGGYVRGLFLVATVDALLIGLALVLIGVPLVVPLMVLTFFAAFFPFVGAILAGLVAALVALVDQGPLAAVLVLVAITVIQQIEGDLLYPLVVGRAVQLHPVAILIALTIGGVLGGVIGAAMAVPIAAVLAAAGSTLADPPDPPRRWRRLRAPPRRAGARP